jgi:hypothetical protein
MPERCRRRQAAAVDYIKVDVSAACASVDQHAATAERVRWVGFYRRS